MRTFSIKRNHTENTVTGKKKYKINVLGTYSNLTTSMNKTRKVFLHPHNILNQMEHDSDSKIERGNMLIV